MRRHCPGSAGQRKPLTLKPQRTTRPPRLRRQQPPSIPVMLATMHRAVILGTGTSIGKTWLTSHLARSAPPDSCLALKPIETGYHAGPHTDAAQLRDAAGQGPDAPFLAFADPLTPWLAAARVRQAIHIPAVVAWVAYQEHATTTHYNTFHPRLTLVETAGGVFSPLSRTATNLDLAKALEPATWLLVATDALGVLHDVSATLFAMRHLDRRPAIVLLTAPPEPDASTGSNLALLRDLHPEQHFLHVPREPAAVLLALYERLTRDA